MTDLSYSDLIAQILDTMRAAGCAPHDPRVIVFGPPKTGIVHRYRVDGDKSGSANGWFIFYDDGVPAGAFGSWKAGITEIWCSKREHELSDTDRSQRDRHLARAKAERAKCPGWRDMADLTLRPRPAHTARATANSVAGRGNPCSKRRTSASRQALFVCLSILYGGLRGAAFGLAGVLLGRFSTPASARHPRCGKRSGGLQGFLRGVRCHV